MIPRKISKHLDGFRFLHRNVIELDTVGDLMRAFSWHKKPVLARDDIDHYESEMDVNQRRLRDAEVLGAVIKNVQPKYALEIGTSEGGATVLMHANSPRSIIYTVNIPPEEILAGQGGKYTTIAIERDRIGIKYREKGITSIRQIFANTKTWQPGIEPIDVAFIDGCHDTWFVVNDTKKILPYCSKGAFILWHDFNLEMIDKYDWIYTVCKGIESLYRKHYLKGSIFHVRNSLIGVYQVNEIPSQT
jgi:predicted O-methyltransferase YrrM